MNGKRHVAPAKNWKLIPEPILGSLEPPGHLTPTQFCIFHVLAHTDTNVHTLTHTHTNTYRHAYEHIQQQQQH